MTTAPVDVRDDQAPSPARDQAGQQAGWLRRSAHIWAPLLVLVALTGPSVGFLLPATQDYLDEIYQPLQALKFFASKGHAIHKYGPLPNFVLAPGYGASLAYWKVTHAFGRPSDDFPYGFKHPFEQMGFLIGQGRVLFLIIGLIGFAVLAHALRRVTASRAAIGFALLFCVATNYILAYELPTPRPDSPMLGFSALALACYVGMVYDRFTARRGIWMSIWAVFAVSSKELAAPMFVLPYLGLLVLAWREDRDHPAGKHAAGQRGGALRAMGWSIAAGVVAYLLLNVVYAPHTWLERMRFWLTGPGIDPEVWGTGTRWGRVFCLLDNFGPAGIVVATIAVIFFLIGRPRHWIMLALPAVSVAVLGLSKIAYPADRFYTIFCLALFPVVAAGLSELLRRLEWSTIGRRAALAVLLLLGAVNAGYATLTWYEVYGNFEYQAERHALAHVPKTQTVYTLNEFPYNPGSQRLEWLGYKHDSRSIQQIAAQKTNLPDWIYTTEGKLGFLEDARKSPGRAEMLRKDEQSPFDINQWHGLEGLGYRLDQTITPRTPAWYPFDWMPAVKDWRKRKALLVYHLSSTATPATHRAAAP
jgi:hypothetical protein